MSVLIYAEAVDGSYKKTAFEIASFARKWADQLGGDCVAITNADEATAAQLGNYGVSKVFSFSSENLHDSSVLARIIADCAQQNGCKNIVLTDDSRAKSILGRIAVKLNAGALSGVNQLPEGNQFSKSVFSAKANAKFELKTENKVISLARNSVPVEETGGQATVASFDASAYESRVTKLEVNRVKGTVPLPEAELVVSAGRGMKGPENWGIIEELADTLGATTACSRPVSDSDWRPHHEHVGQTGIAIKPNLYIAVGISGAIQHLAGVNNSKTIVVINKDPEAPFFKAADYGVVGDLFDVVPRLNEALKKFKAG